MTAEDGGTTCSVLANSGHSVTHRSYLLQMSALQPLLYAPPLLHPGVASAFSSCRIMGAYEAGVAQ